MAVAAWAETKQFWQMGDVTDVRDTDVFLLRRPGFHPYSGARNISGLWLKQALTTAGPQGPAGYDGNDGAPGANGINGTNGTNGTNGKTYTCMISGGVRTILFDQYGLNPQPSPLFAYSVLLYEDGLQVTPATYAWSTSATKTLLSGSGAGASFTPAIFSPWSSAKSNNYVSATVTYAGQTCRADAPISITRIGDTGPQGPTGSAGSPDTQAQILAKIATATDGTILTMQQGATEAAIAPKFQVKDRPGNARIYCDSSACYFKDLNGYVRVQIDPVTYSLVMRDASNVVTYSVDTLGQIRSYHPDGVRLSFATYTAGRVVIQ